jgi:hypothetical protein
MVNPKNGPKSWFAAMIGLTHDQSAAAKAGDG